MAKSAREEALFWLKEFVGNVTAERIKTKVNEPIAERFVDAIIRAVKEEIDAR